MADHQPSHTSADEQPAALLALAVIAAGFTILLTLTAFWLSYAHLHVVAEDNGLKADQIRAWAWPATVDMFIVIGEVLILRASLQGRVDPWAIGLTVAGSAGSIALNVAGVGDGRAAMHYVVAAVPPIAALLAFGALMNQVHRYLAARVTAPATVETAADEGDTAGDDEPQDEAPAPVEYTNPVDCAIRPLYDSGYRPTTGQMTAAMKAAGLDPVGSTARASRGRIEEREPHLARFPQRLATGS